MINKLTINYFKFLILVDLFRSKIDKNIKRINSSLSFLLRSRRDKVQKTKEILSEIEELHTAIKSKGDMDSSELKAELTLYVIDRKEIFDRYIDAYTKLTVKEKVIADGLMFRSQFYLDSLTAPIYAQTTIKPNGYAGDAVVMKYMYENEFRGETPLAKIIHKWVCLSEASQAVRNRRVLLLS